MLIYKDWLNEYIDIDVDIDTFCDRMIMSGSNIENVKHYGIGFNKVVIGKIDSIKEHPNADKLIICMIDIGENELLQIVTGAANVFAGAFVPVILHGGKLPNGNVIKKGKLRGVDSYGMLCSAKELGYEDKVIPVPHKDGIWILDKEYPLGHDLVDVLELDGHVIDFEITPNRPDCLSMIGMARETAATFGGCLNYPDTLCVKEEASADDFIDVEINDTKLCERYVARVITDVKIQQSPWWMQRRLMYAGVRPINNIVDITNYVMLEYGQPLHAFDIKNINGNKIIIDRSKKGESFTTLDGMERKLSEGMLLIKDCERPVAIAGVMGGLNSEIESDTTTIIIESANFNADSVRKTSKKLGLRTEASSRFEKGIDPNLASIAADRVCKLVELLEIGTVISGSVDVYPTIKQPKTVDVRVDKINKVLGINLSHSEIQDIFRSLEMKSEYIDGIIKVTPPTVRQDLSREVDFIEEVARMYGYDKMPMTLPKGNSRSQQTETQILRNTVREALVGLGVSEIQTYSFINPKGIDNINIDVQSKEKDVIRLINPLGEENCVMRTLLTPGMLEVLSRNYTRNISAVKAFEIGNAFINIPTQSGLPTEQERICIACYGTKEDFFTLKGIVNEMLYKIGINSPEYISESNMGTYHPGRCAKITHQEKELGVIGEFHPDVLEVYGIETRAYSCELDFNKIIEVATRERFYKPLPKYPSSNRDIALLVKEEVHVGEIEAIIKDKGTELLEELVLFDVYRGKQIPEGQKSVAFSLVYRAADKTLTDEEVTGVHDKVLAALKDEIDATLREI